MTVEEDLEKATKLVEKLRGEVKDLKADKEPQAEKDQKTIAAMQRKIDELTPLATKAKEAEDAGKSKDDKIDERLAAAEKRAQDAEQRAIRLEVVTSTGLTTAQAKYLRGSTKEELEASAKEILDDFPTKDAGDAGGGGGEGTGAGGARRTTSRPKENLGGGNEPEEEPEETDPRKLAEKVSRT